MRTDEPFVALMRRYVNDYTNRHDTSVCVDIMEPDYTLRMGEHVVRGRDEEYIPAANQQFTQFPGLCLTLHQIVTNGDRLAMLFSEHGRSVRHGRRAAAWVGLGLYRWNGRKLVENYVEQDYVSRRRQLASGSPATVETPATAPWDTVREAPDPAGERVVRQWVSDQLIGGGVVYDDGDDARLLEDARCDIDDIFSAGEHVAFRLSQHGRYAGGLGPEHDVLTGAPATLHMVGLVSVRDGCIQGGRIVRDRLGLTRSLARAV